LWEVADTTRVFLVAEGHPFERVLFLSGGRPGRRLPSLVTGHHAHWSARLNQPIPGRTRVVGCGPYPLLGGLLNLAHDKFGSRLLSDPEEVSSVIAVEEFTAQAAQWLR